ncbi:MAG: NADH-quinone oxidoreductase subunit N [Ignavibacteria bacterium]|nr:NADH-quinone oxidoreductase subunit N [Ignavibacteria bacterium]
MIPVQDLFASAPLLIIGGSILIALILEMVFDSQSSIVAWFSGSALLFTAYWSLYHLYDRGFAFNNMISISGRTQLLFFIVNFAAAVVVMFSMDYIKKIQTNYGEFYILLLSAVLGMMLIAAARDMVIVFIGLEQMSICFYVLAGFRRKNIKSNESAIKYFLLGSFATGFIVYGMALLYGASQTFSIPEYLAHVETLKSNPIFLLGSLLFVIGFTFKIAAVPFHMWVPDVYQGAPTNVTAFMSTAGKVSGFAALITFLSPFIDYSARTTGSAKFFMPFLATLSVLSMLYGAIVALSQSDVKRMLAYSSIAHAGYMLIGLSALSYEGVDGVLFYLVAYTLMNLGAFGIISILETQDEKMLKIEDFAGLSSRSPLLAAFLAVFLFALAGLPPFAGFFGKYFVFVSAVENGMTWLAIVGVISSVISVYFYLRIIVLMYFSKGENTEVVSVPKSALLGVFVVFIMFVIMSAFPQKFEGIIHTIGLLTY